MFFKKARKSFPANRGNFYQIKEVVLYSNASEEKFFSIVRKNKTEFRSGLDLGRSINSIMRIKMSLPESLVSCYEWKPSQDLLRKCKSATSTYNKEHSNKEKFTDLITCYFSVIAFQSSK